MTEQYSFFHDRVREAVGTMVSPDQARNHHLVFGRLALQHMDATAEPTDAQVRTLTMPRVGSRGAFS